jgi:hypothetical protein
MDEEEFNRLLQKANENNLGEFSNVGNLGGGPKTFDQIRIEREEVARKKQAQELDILKKQEQKEAAESKPIFGPGGYMNQWIVNTGLKSVAMIGDMAHLLDVGDYHNYMPESFKTYWNPVYALSKGIDETIGDGELEVGNFISNFTSKGRDIANRYYSDYGEGAKNVKDPVFGWSVEDWLNGSSDLVGSVVGVLTPGGAIRAGATGLAKLGLSATAASRAAQVVSTGAMTMAVSGSIGTEVYDNVQEHWLEKDASYAELKASTFNNAMQEFYKNNPNGAKYEAEAYAEEQQDMAREAFIADPKNAETVKLAKENAILGTDVALKTSFVFGLATNFLVGHLIARPLNKKVTTASTRKFSEVLSKDGTKKVVQNKTFFEKPLVTAGAEAGMEAAEEGFFEMYAQKKGELAGKKMDYGFSDVMDEFTWDEFTKSAVFGALGGGLTAGAFNFIDGRSEEARQELADAKKQMQEFNNILEASGGLNLKEVAYLEGSTKEQVALLKQAKNLAAQGKKDEAEAIQKRVLGLQSLAAFETGTTEKLRETYSYIANDEKNTQEVRDNANKALQEIAELEKNYLEIYNTDKLNKKQLFINKLNKNFASKQLAELDLEISKKKTELLADIATKSEAGKMESLEVNKKLKGDKPGDVTILQEKEELTFDADDIGKDTSKKFEFDDENQAYDKYKKQVLGFENAKQLQQLQENRKEALEYISTLDDDFNEMSSKEYQNKLKAEKNLIDSYNSREEKVLSNIVGKSDKEASQYIDDMFGKFKDKTFKDSYKTFKDKILATKKKLDREVKQQNLKAAETIAQDSNKENSENERTPAEKVKEQSKDKDIEIKQETKAETNPIIDETTKPDSSLDVANNTTNTSSLGKGMTKEEFEQGDFNFDFNKALEDDVEVAAEQYNPDVEKDIEESFNTDVEQKSIIDDPEIPADVLNGLIDDYTKEEISDGTDDVELNAEDLDLSPVELNSDASKEELQKLAALIKVYKGKKDRVENKDTSFRDFIEDYINKVGEEKTKDKFNALKDSWLIAGFKINEDVNNIYQDYFTDIGDLLLQIDEKIDVLSIPSVAEESVSQDKTTTDLSEDNELVPTPVPVDENNNLSIDVFNTSTAPQLAYLSLENELAIDENGEGSRTYTNASELNKKSELDNPHDILNYNKYLPGEELTATIPDNFEDLPIAVYDDLGRPLTKPDGKSYTFREWYEVNKANIPVGSQEYIDKIPMVITNKDGESIAYVRDTQWINPYNMDAQSRNDEVIIEAKKENRRIRNAIYNNKDKTAKLVITQKTKGVYNGAIQSAENFVEQNGRNPTLAEAGGFHINPESGQKEYQTKVAVFDQNRQGFLTAGGEIVKVEDLANTEKFPIESTTGQKIWNYELRQVTSEVVDGKIVPKYMAYVITGRGNNDQKKLSSLFYHVMKLNSLYKMAKSAANNNETNEDGEPLYTEEQKAIYKKELAKYEKIFSEIKDKTGFDFTQGQNEPRSIIKFLSSYTRIKEIDLSGVPREKISNKIREFALNDKSLQVGQSAAYKVFGNLYIVNKFIAKQGDNKGKPVVGMNFINLNSGSEKAFSEMFNGNNPKGSGFINSIMKLKTDQSINKKALEINKSQIDSLNFKVNFDKETNTFTISDTDIKYKQGTYEDMLLNTAESSVMAYNIGSEQNPFMVTNTQPRVNYDLAEAVEDNVQKETVTSKIETEAENQVERDNIEGDITDTEENLTEEPVVVTQPVEDVEAKKAEIEKRRKEEINNYYSEGNIANPIFISIRDQILNTSLITPAEKRKVQKYLKSLFNLGLSHKEIVSKINAKFDFLNIQYKETAIDRINAKYDAELAALETQPVFTEDVKEQKVYRTENTFSSKVEYAQRGGGKYYALDEPFKDADTKEGDISELSVKYDANKNLDATTDEGQKEFMDIKSKAIGGKKFNSLEESNEAVRQAMLDAGYTSLTGYINNDTKGNRELVIYEDYTENVETVEEVIPTDENQRKAEEEKLIALKEKQKELSEKSKKELTPEEKSKNRTIDKKISELNLKKDNLEINQTLAEDETTKENIQQEIDNINKQVNDLENQIVEAKDKDLEKETYSREEIDAIYQQSEDLLAFDNDENFDDYSPVELTEEEVERMSQDLLRIEGVNPTHQTELANYIYHEASKTLTEFEGVIEKSKLKDKIEENFLKVLDTKIAVFEKNRDILENVDEAKAKALVERYNNAIDYLNTIKNNADIIIDEGLSIARKEIGVNETKEKREADENPEVNLDNVTEKDHSKTFLEEGGKDKITYQLKRFFSDIPMTDVDGNLVKGIFGVQKYVPFDVMFNTVQSILANSYPNFDEMIAKLEISSSKNPAIKTLIDKLKGADKQTQNQFVTVMSKNDTGMQFISISTTKNRQTGKTSYYLDIYDTNSANVTRQIRNAWFNNFKLSPLVDYKEEKLFINKDKAREILDEYDSAANFQRLPAFATALIDKQIKLGKNSFKKTRSLSRLKPNVDYVFQTKDGDFVINSKDGNTFSIKPFSEKESFKILLEGKYTKEAADSLNKFLNNFGINLSYKTIETLVKDGLYINKGNKPSLKNLFLEDSEQNIFGSLVRYLRDSLKVEKDADNNIIEKSFDKETNNPLANSVFASLAKEEAKHNENMIMPTSFRDGKKTIQQYTVSKYLTDRILELKSESDESLRNQLKNTSFSKHSYLLNFLSTRPDLRRAFGVNYLGINSIKQRGSALFKTTGITSISSADHELVKLGFFMNHRLSSSLTELEHKTQFGQILGMRMAQMVSPTMSDKSTATVVTMPVFNFSKENFISPIGEIELSTGVINAMYEQILVPEIQRMFDYHQMQNKPNIKAYDKGATKFLMTPLANKLTTNGKDGAQTLPQMIEYYAKNPADLGNKTIHEKVASLFNNQLKEMFNSYVKNEFAETMKKWDEFGIARYDDKGNLIIKGIDERYLKNQSKFPKDQKITLDDKVKTLALDFIVNSMIANSNMFMTMAGDPAMYYKSKAEDSIQQSKDTFENIGKRLANQIAPGIKPADAKDNKYIQLFLEDIEAPASNLLYLAKALEVEGFGQKQIDELKKALSENDGDTIKDLKKKFPQLAPYFQIEGTDAQEYTTWKEHLYLLEKLGKTNPELFHDKITSEDIENARDLFSSGKPLSQMSAKEKGLVKLVMQPMKPVYTGQIYDDAAKVMRTVYIKSSSMPLIPQLTKGLEINRLREAMEAIEAKENRTVRASYSTANKVGSLKTPTKLFNNGTGAYIENSNAKDDTKQDDLIAKLNSNKLVLDRNNFRIQQEVPFKSGKRQEDYVKQGTQTTKLLLGDGITDINGFLYNGEKVSGKDLRDAYDNNFGKLLTLKKKQLLQELSIDSTTGRSNNPRVTANKLQSLLKEEAESRGYAKQVVDSLGVDLIMKNGEVIDYEFTLPLWMSAESNRFESLLNSIATNRVAKIKMPGNSYVAASQEGFREVVSEAKGDPSKIVYTSKWEGELKGAEFNADGSLKKTQVFLPSKFRDNEGKMLDMFAKDANNNYIYVKQEKEGGPFMLREEMFDEELLSNISFRTPTSAHLSMADVEIVGFVPYECGDLIVVPRNLTVQVGLDFDIDKQTNYQYFHEVDANGKVVMLKDNIEDIERKIEYNNQILEDKNYIRKQEEYINLKERIKEEKQERKNKINEFRKSKDSRNAEAELLKEEAQDIYSEIEGIKKEIVEAKVELSNQETKEGKEEIINLVKKLYKSKKLKHKELAKTVNRLRGLNVDLKTISAKKKIISDSYKKLEEKRAELKELNVIERKVKVYEKRLEKLYKNEIVKIHSSVLSNPQVEVQKKIAGALSIENAREQSEMLRELKSGSENNSLETFNPLTSNYQKGVMQAGAAGKVGIGAYSNDVVFHSLVRQNDEQIGLTRSVRFGNLTSKTFGNDSAIKEDKAENYYKLLPIIKRLEPQVYNQFNGDKILDMLFTKEGDNLVRQDEANLSLAYNFIENIILPNLENEGLIEEIEYFKNPARSVTEILAERQNIATDNAKELIMEDAGLNDETLDVDKVMVLLGFDTDRSGNSIPFFFLNQPIIKEFISEIKNLDSKISDFIPDKEQYVIDKLNEKYKFFDIKGDREDSDILNENASSMTGEKFQKEISAFTDTGEIAKESVEFQYASLLQFIKLRNIGKQLRSIQKNFNVDSQGIGKSTFDLYDRVERLNDLAFSENVFTAFGSTMASLIGDFSKSPVEGYTKLSNDLYVRPTTAIGHFTVNTLSTALAITNKELPYNSFSMLTQMDEIMDNTTVSESGKIDLRQNIAENMKMYFNSFDFNLYTKNSRLERKELFIDNEETGQTSLAKYLAQQLNNTSAKNFKFLNSIPLLKNFEFDIKQDGTPSIIKFNNTIDNVDENSLYSSLFLMLEKNLPLENINGQPYTTRMLAQDLINYSLLQGGVQKAIEFNKFIPIAFLKNTAYASTLRSVNKDLNDGVNVFRVSSKEDKEINPHDVSDFTIQYFQHNPSKAPSIEINKNSAVKVTSTDPDTKDILEFTYESKKPENMPVFFRVYNGSANKNADLYMTKNGRTYFKIPTLGTYGMESEYDASTMNRSFLESIIPSASKIAALKAKQVETNTRLAAASKKDTDNVTESDTDSLNTTKDSMVITVESIVDSENIKNKNLQTMAKMILPFLDPNTKLVTDVAGKYEGKYSQERNTVFINPNFIAEMKKTNDLDRLAKVILHEITHSITVNELEKHIEFGSNKQIINVKDGAPKYVQNLVRIFNNFKIKAEQGLEHNGVKYNLQDLKNKMKNDIPVNSFENNILYGAYNIREFLALATSSKEFQEYLHKTNYKATDKSFFQKFKDAIAGMFNALTKELNISISKSDEYSQSDFTEAIEATFELIQEGALDRKQNFGETLYNEKDNSTGEFLDNVDSVLGEKKQLGEPTTQLQTKPVKKDNPIQIGTKFPKDQVKANYADGIIGYGIGSTGKYAEAFGGTRTTFLPGETIMISVNGKNRPNQAENVEKTKQAIDKAIASGVSFFIADNLNTANSDFNKSGEGVIREYLLSKGLEYENFNGVGLYSVKQPTIQPTIQPKVETKPETKPVEQVEPFDINITGNYGSGGYETYRSGGVEIKEDKRTQYTRTGIFFEETTRNNKKVFTLIDTTIVDHVNRVAAYTISLVFDKDTKKTMDDAKKQLSDIYTSLEKYKGRVNQYGKRVNAFKLEEGTIENIINTILDFKKENDKKVEESKKAQPKSISPLGAGFKKGEIDVDNLSNKDLGLDDNFDAADYLNVDDLSPVQQDILKTIEQDFNIRNLDGSRKRFLKKNYKTVLKKVQQLNKSNKNTSFKFKIIEVMGEKGDSRTYYAIAAIQKNNVNFSNVNQLDNLINDFEKTCK